MVEQFLDEDFEFLAVSYVATEMPSTYNENGGTVTWTTGTHCFYMIQTKAQSGAGSGSIYWPPTTRQPAEPETPETPETPEPTKSDIQASLDGQNLMARSQLVTMKNCKKTIKVTWFDKTARRRSSQPGKRSTTTPPSRPASGTTIKSAAMWNPKAKSCTPTTRKKPGER